MTLQSDNMVPHGNNNFHSCTALVSGWYFHQPGHSCKSIRDSGDFKRDGDYWIDPESNGNPLSVYCDMTTDGGKKLLDQHLE